MTFDAVWARVIRHQGETFKTASGLDFTYQVPGNFVRVLREGKEINRVLSRTNFARAAERMPASGPGALRDRQGASYTWAILNDRRDREPDW